MPLPFILIPGNLIIPIVMSLFGKEWVIYASCFIVVQTFLFWTHCRLIIVGKGNLSLKTIAKNINIWSILVGAFCLLSKLSCQILSMALSSIGLFIGPNAMLVAGMLIAAIPLRRHRVIQTHLFSHTFALVTYSDCIIGINKVDWFCTLG